MGPTSLPYPPPSDQKLHQALPLSGAWAHTPSPFQLTAQPNLLYTSSAFPTVVSLPASRSPTCGLCPPDSNPNLSNLYSKALLSIDPLQQPFFYGNKTGQPYNRSEVEADESSAHSKPTKLSMYSKNSVTLFPNLPSNYITSCLESSTRNFPCEKLNGQNYFSWSQSVKMFLEGHHQFGFLTGETVRPPPGDTLERLWKAEDSLIRFILINSMEP